MAHRALKLSGRRALPFKSVLAALADHHNAKTGMCFPSTERIARQAGVSRTSLPAILQSLRQQEFINFSDNDGGRGRSTRYDLLFIEPYEHFLQTGFWMPGEAQVFTRELVDGALRWVAMGAKNSRPGRQNRNRKLSAKSRQTVGPKEKTVGRTAKTVGPADRNHESESINPRARVASDDARAELMRNVTDVARQKRVEPAAARKAKRVAK